jgi:HD-GYP domain-containing protein (c-di-GMP phosphodiesterase class II)
MCLLEFWIFGHCSLYCKGCIIRELKKGKESSMSTLTLLHPVRTLNNRLLVPAGTVLSAETFDAIISSSRATSHQTHSLLQHGSVKSDLLSLLNQPPYEVIFADQKQIANLINIMERVHLALPILQSLDYFNQHDFYTYRHILVVFALSILLAKDLVSDYQDLIQQAATGPSHDLGKVCVPLHILKKPDPLTQSERSILEHHSGAGFVLLCYYLKDSENLSARVARDHHERRNGSGYPCGINLTDPMIEIISVSDVYDALIAVRPYRPVSYDNRTALEEITRMAENIEIGWDVVKVLAAHNRKDKPHYTEVTVSMEKRGTPPSGNLYGVTAEEKNHPPS